MRLYKKNSTQKFVCKYKTLIIMSVVIETTIGDFTVDLYVNERPQSKINYIKINF